MTTNHDRAQLATLGGSAPCDVCNGTRKSGVLGILIPCSRCRGVGTRPAPDAPLDLDAIDARARKRDTFSMRPLPSCDHEERGHAPACFACVSAARDAEGTTFHTHGRNDVIALLSRVRELEDLIQRQGALLLATANALKGPPAPLSQHSAHDLPEVATRMRADIAARDQIAAETRELFAWVDEDAPEMAQEKTQ